MFIAVIVDDMQCSVVIKTSERDRIIHAGTPAAGCGLQLGVGSAKGILLTLRFYPG